MRVCSLTLSREFTHRTRGGAPRAGPLTRLVPPCPCPRGRHARGERPGARAVRVLRHALPRLAQRPAVVPPGPARRRHAQGKARGRTPPQGALRAPARGARRLWKGDRPALRRRAAAGGARPPPAPCVGQRARGAGGRCGRHRKVRGAAGASHGGAAEQAGEHGAPCLGARGGARARRPAPPAPRARRRTAEPRRSLSFREAR